MAEKKKRKGDGTQDIQVVGAYFHIEGDNIHYKGYYDPNRKFEGYVCPIFDKVTASKVAAYISDQVKQLYFDETIGTYLIALPEKEKVYSLSAMDINGERHYDFSATAPWVVSAIIQQRGGKENGI